MKKPLSDKELTAFVFMKDYFHTEDMLPNLTEVAKHIGTGGASSGAAICHRLETKGYIERNQAGRYRFVRESVSPRGAREGAGA